ASGTIAYEIGTRNANTLLRLKDGETQILAGLIQDTDTRNFSSIPGLGDIPILRHLFGEHHLDREKSEIVLSITPRIIRMQPRAASDTTEFWYGSESRTRSRPYTTSERGADTHPGRPEAAAPSPSPGINTAPGGAPVPSSGPQPVNPSVAPSSVSAPLSGPGAQNQSAPAPQVVPASAGTPTVNTRGVGAQLDVTTPTEDPVLGSGTLMTVRFKALAPRPSSNVAAMLNVLGTTGGAVGSSAAQPLAIVIHP